MGKNQNNRKYVTLYTGCLLLTTPSTQHSTLLLCCYFDRVLIFNVDDHALFKRAINAEGAETTLSTVAGEMSDADAREYMSSGTNA